MSWHKVRQPLRHCTALKGRRAGNEVERSEREVRRKPGEARKASVSLRPRREAGR